MLFHVVVEKVVIDGWITANILSGYASQIRDEKEDYFYVMLYIIDLDSRRLIFRLKYSLFRWNKWKILYHKLPYEDFMALYLAWLKAVK